MWFPSREEYFGKKLAEAAASLYKKEYITWSKGQEQTVVIEEPINTMVRAMAEADYCILIRRKETDYGVKCCYLSRAFIVITEQSQREKEMLRLTGYTVPDWIEWFWEEQIFPKEEVFWEGDILKESLDELLPFRKSDKYFEDDSVTAVLELRTIENGQVKERLIVRQKGIQYRIYVQHGIEIKSFIYDKKKCIQMIKGWL